jgi:hypothetical protein
MTKRKGIIKIVRTEQWEYTAFYGKGKDSIQAVGSSETSAERNLLRKLVFGTDKHNAINEYGTEIT